MNDLAHTNAEILIVDDEPSVVRLLTRALQSAGYQSVRGFGDPEGYVYSDSRRNSAIFVDQSA